MFILHLFEAGYLCVNCFLYVSGCLMYGMFTCDYLLRVFDPGRLSLVSVGSLNELTNELRVFDPSRLLVVRVGNLNELTNKLRVFDPGRLLVVRVGNLNEYEK